MASPRAWVYVHEEVNDGAAPHDWSLNFQWCTYNYSDGSPPEDGYRFIWRHPVNHKGNRNLQGARGQARIPTLAQAKALMDKAALAGWAIH